MWGKYVYLYLALLSCNTDGHRGSEAVTRTFYTCVHARMLTLLFKVQRLSSSQSVESLFARQSQVMLFQARLESLHSVCLYWGQIFWMEQMLLFIYLFWYWVMHIAAPTKSKTLSGERFVRREYVSVTLRSVNLSNPNVTNPQNIQSKWRTS